MTGFFDRGFTNMTIVQHSAASGGQAVEGLDKMLEWIDIPVRFEGTGSYTVAFRHASVQAGTVILSVQSAGPRKEDVEWSIALIPGTCGH